MTVLKRAWVALVVLVAVIVGGVAVDRLSGVFPGPGLPKPDPRDATPPYAAKTAIYEILGPPGTTGVVNWMDAESLPQKANFTTLPWSTTIVAAMPGIFAYVVAQGDSPSIGCRITVDGKLVDQRQAETRNAAVSCLDKSA
ncbi:MULTISPECIES: MmpS family transport accessory protein [unclassified Mycobacterium]|uniref:MmpS family transport accessory protein n=1 Tax=unclassified Mycobacterium TaxID=2642494 RepID=UPI0018D3CFFB|nr:MULTISPECIES: MmpS family transport accessory protein [unclassified Mycobacterium]